MNLRMYYFRIILFITHTTLISMDQLESWEMIRQDALNYAQIFTI